SRQPRPHRHLAPVAGSRAALGHGHTVPEGPAAATPRDQLAQGLCFAALRQRASPRPGGAHGRREVANRERRKCESGHVVSVTRPKLLFLSQTLPFPPDGGVKIRTYNVLKQLATAFDIVALCFYRAKAAGFNQQVDAALVGLGEFARVEAFPIPQEHSRPRLLRDHVQSLLSARVYTAFAYRSPRFRARLVQLLHEERFDLAHADSLDLSDYFPLIEGVPVVCVHHDAQSVLLRRRADRYRTPWNRWYLSHQAELMRREESWWCPPVALNVAVSETDQDALKTVAPAGRFTVVPNGVDLEYFR